MHMNVAIALAVGALIVSGTSPLVLVLFQRRAGNKDARKHRAQEDAHQEDIAAEAMKLAKHHLLTTSMEYELQAVQHAINAINDAITLKQESGIPIPQQTHVSLLTIREHAHALEVEIFERKENV